MKAETALNHLEYELHEECHMEYMEEELETAFKALKKQIPKKVLYEDVGYDPHIYACICPKCELKIIIFEDSECESESDDPEMIFKSTIVHPAYMGLNSYCNRCGQKLDWGEKE